MTGELVEVVIGDYTETLMATVSRDLDGDDPPTHAPASWVDAWELAHTRLSHISDALIAYAAGQHQDPPAGLNQVQPELGDPRECWNPFRHSPHIHDYQVGNRNGVTYCPGDGQRAAATMGRFCEPR